MNLHPIPALLGKIKDRNEKQLALATAALDHAVQYVYAKHVPRFAPADLNGAVLAINVRNEMAWYASLPTFVREGFQVSVGPNCSLTFWDPEAVGIKVRKHPRRKVKKQWELVPVTPLDVEVGQGTLFGPEDEYEPVLWRPTVLWHPDPGTQTLKAAWLGALESDVDRPRVFCRVPLEIGSPALLAEDLAVTERPKDTLDFDDMFGEEGTGDSLA